MIVYDKSSGNILIHREYTNAFPAKIIIESDRIYAENGNKPHGYGAINPDNYTPYPKNPVIAGVFKQIGLADELGSGVRNLIKYVQIYSKTIPELIEEDIFKVIIPLSPRITSWKTGSGEMESDLPGIVHGVHDGGYDGGYDGVHDGVHDEVNDILLSKTEEKILANLRSARSTPQLLAELGYKKRTRNYVAALKKLLTCKLIEMTLPDKPRSKKQQYRLTSKGSAWLNSNTIPG